MRTGKNMQKRLKIGSIGAMVSITELAWIAGVSTRVAARWVRSDRISMKKLVARYAEMLDKVDRSLVVDVGKCGRRNIFYWVKGQLYIHWRGRKYWVKEITDTVIIHGEVLDGAWHKTERGSVYKYKIKDNGSKI
jgi:hypothetical protein